jgi:hypothetical protein
LAIAWASTTLRSTQRRFSLRRTGQGARPAVYQCLVMRQGLDTVKPDVHVRRFAEAAVGQKLND